MPNDEIQNDQQTDSDDVILLVDDHPVVFAGIRLLIEETGGTVIRNAQSFAEAFRFCRSRRPAIVIVDLAMGAGALAGLSFIRRLRRYDESVPILVLSMYDDPRIAHEALKVGANGYVVKDASNDEIAMALTTVRQGLPYVSRILASDLAFLRNREPKTLALEALSSRERFILSLLADGKSYTQIADNLALSYKSVAHICNRLKPKLGVQSLQELVHFAVQNFPAPPNVARPLAKGSKKTG
ncbi:response regulator transcription factor [Methyloceanibacter sp. wino2]|uniref:response regulator transcription factor n=1 Tax=Methyloceanibacter sp. wino2 TaxID=2170729 RepID=UPI000D3ED57A|nr:response regulator transcription factor [Methyloceanibacter sp. wino2]